MSATKSTGIWFRICWASGHLPQIFPRPQGWTVIQVLGRVRCLWCSLWRFHTSHFARPDTTIRCNKTAEDQKLVTWWGRSPLGPLPLWRPVCVQVCCPGLTAAPKSKERPQDVGPILFACDAKIWPNWSKASKANNATRNAHNDL
jgi:hypothetical protein